MIKTCGTTVPLDCVDYLVTEAIRQGFNPLDFTYSRSSFLFPDKQFYPHNDLQTELDYLSYKMRINGKIVGGKSSILGDPNGKYWLIHRKSLEGTIDVQTPDNRSSPTFTFTRGTIVDIIMTGLDKTACIGYFKNISKSETENESDMAQSLSGILPEFKTITGKCYDPCGYSCNAMHNERYLTVHITPEEAFSYASVEASFESSGMKTTRILDHCPSMSTIAEDDCMDDSITQFIENVITVFKPRDFIVTLISPTAVSGGLPTKLRGADTTKTGMDKTAYTTEYVQSTEPYTSGTLLGEDIVASSVFYSAVSSGATGNKPPGLS